MSETDEDPIKLELQTILEHVQALVEHQNLDGLQILLDEVTSFLLNLKTIFDAEFIPVQLQNHVKKSYIQLEKPLTGLFSKEHYKNKVTLKLKEGTTNEVIEHIDIKEDIAFVKVETDNDEYIPPTIVYKDKKQEIKQEIEDTDPDYNPDIGNDDDADNDEENDKDFNMDEDGAPKKTYHSFYKKGGLKNLGYKDSYPISKEVYDEIISKGEPPFVCPRCDKPCTRRLVFDYHLMKHEKKCTGIKMIWPKWKKVKVIILSDEDLLCSYEIILTGLKYF